MKEHQWSGVRDRSMHRRGLEAHMYACERQLACTLQEWLHTEVLPCTYLFEYLCMYVPLSHMVNSFHLISGNTSQNTESNKSDVSATYGCLHQWKVVNVLSTVSHICYDVFITMQQNGVICFPCAPQNIIWCMCLVCASTGEPWHRLLSTLLQGGALWVDVACGT